MIEFLKEQHIYLVDGVITPSVSQLLKELFPNKYDDIPQAILDNKARFGTRVHEAIEELETSVNKEKQNDLTYMERLGVEEYKKLKKQYKWKTLSNEKIVSYKDIYCGTYDMTFLLDGVECLADIKTTTELDEEYLSWQLSLYNLAEDYKYQKIYCIWLPKGKAGQLIEITLKDKQTVIEFAERNKNG